MESELESENDIGSLDPLAWRLADGDPGAPRELVERHHAELYRYARALMRDAPTAEDAVQEAFERAFTALGKYPEERIKTLSLRPWLYRITLNVVRNTWRDSRREVTVAETPKPDERFGAVSGLASGADREAWLDTLEAMGRLSERQRVAVALRYLEDLPIRRDLRGHRLAGEHLQEPGASGYWTSRCAVVRRIGWKRRQLDEQRRVAKVE